MEIQQYITQEAGGQARQQGVRRSGGMNGGPFNKVLIKDGYTGGSGTQDSRRERGREKRAICAWTSGSKGSLIKVIIPDGRQRRKGDYKTPRSETSCWLMV